jgi:hypothetical protein
MYAIVSSRPNLSYAMSLVSRYMANPGKEYWKVVQYLGDTSKAYLKFSKTGKKLGYVDSDFVTDLDKRNTEASWIHQITCESSKKLTEKQTNWIYYTENVRVSNMGEIVLGLYIYPDWYHRARINKFYVVYNIIWHI